jgi:diguanylate cyclase (GGDEF)-like protein
MNVSNVVPGSRLQDVFTSERWRQHFATLSDAVGFALGIYAESGAPLVASPLPPNYCNALLSTSRKYECDAGCRRVIAKALSRRRPVLSKCHARIVCFALPVEYGSDRAVIIGRGSFATYHDFRKFMALMNEDEAVDSGLAVAAPLHFTSAGAARRACAAVNSVVEQFLRNTQENVALRTKMETLKEVVSRWGASSGQDAAAVYEHLMEGMLHLLDVQQVTLFFWDRQQGVYAPLYSRNKNGSAAESLILEEHDAVVRMLLEQQPYVLSTEPVIGRQTGAVKGSETYHFFPLWIHGSLEGVLGVSDGLLKESDIYLIRAFCKQAMLTIENTRYHTDLYRKLDRFAAIAELTKAITPIRSYEALLQSILDKSAELLKAEQGSLMLLDQETDALLLEAKKGVISGMTDKMRIPRGVGIAGKVAEMGEPLLVENLESDPRVRQKNRRHYKTRSFVSVPLKIGDRTIGVLNLSDKTTGEVFNEEDLRLVQSFASHAAVVLERNVLYDQAERLKKLSITDPLTGLLNRRYLEERLEEEISRSSRHARRVSLMMLDIDGFKPYNDTFGHIAGDTLLKLIAESIMNSVRTMDIVSRLGGDEFLVILPETDALLAKQIAERIRSEVERLAVPPRGAERSVKTATVSIGIACYPSHGDTIEVLLEQVDKALYLAKLQGKNRTEVLP